MTMPPPGETPDARTAAGAVAPEYGQAVPVGYYAGAPVPPAYWGPHPSEKNWMGVTSLVLGLAFMVAGPITAIPGVIFGHLGRAAARRGEATNGNLALAGLIVSYVGLGVMVVVGILYLAYVVFLVWMFTEVGSGELSTEMAGA